MLVSGKTNRIEIDDKNYGLSLGQAIILAEYGDTIIVHTESQRELGESLARLEKPAVHIHFVVKPNSNGRNLSHVTRLIRKLCKL